MQRDFSFFTEVDTPSSNLDLNLDSSTSTSSGFGFDFDDYDFIKIEPVTFDTFNERLEESENYAIETAEADFSFTAQISLFDEEGNLDVVFTDNPNSFINSFVESNADLDLDLNSDEARRSSSSTFLSNFSNDVFADDSSLQSSLIDLDSDSSYGSISQSNSKNVLGNSSNNLLVGSSSANAIQGFAGDDYLAGNSGADSLTGGSGDDFLAGGTGDDSLVGGSSSADATEYDNLQGGQGADTFVIGDRTNIFYEGNGYATITDFSKSEDDLIQLHGNSSDYSFTEVDDGLQIRYDSDLVAEVNGIESLGSDELDFV